MLRGSMIQRAWSRAVSAKGASTITSAAVVHASSGEWLVSLAVDRAGSRARLVLPLVWLRDHCRSDAAYFHSTHQRKSNAANLSALAKVDNENAIKFDVGSQRLSIVWSDGHQTEFATDQLLQFALKREKIPQADLRTLWTKETIKELPIIDLKSYSMARLAEHFVRFGFVCVDGVETTAAETEAFCREVGPLHDTFFGAFYVFNNKAEAQDAYFADTAYTNEAIGPHTDGTYFLHSPGIQVFHCLHPADRGGETLLVDGFAAAERLRKESPEAFRTLATTPIDHHYIEQGERPLLSRATERHVIELDASGRLRQVRFNPYDRAPYAAFELSDAKSTEIPEEVHSVSAFYSAYEHFSRICHDPASALTISLQPGTVIFIDNLRVMHARSAFSGYRQMCGCYMSHDNFMAKARPHLSEEIREHV